MMIELTENLIQKTKGYRTKYPMIEIEVIDNEHIHIKSKITEDDYFEILDIPKSYKTKIKDKFGLQYKDSVIEGVILNMINKSLFFDVFSPSAAYRDQIGIRLNISIKGFIE
jgi:hypothetical protein